MIALDTSVVIAAFASWDEDHAAAQAALRRRPRLPAHALIESYSVLTRLPAPHTVAAATVLTFLQAAFPAPALGLAATAYAELVRDAVSAGIAGGAIYDALIATTAKRAGAILLTRDRRALPTYEKVGVGYDLLGA